MKYYKKISIEYLQVIQEKVLDFIRLQPNIYYRRLNTSYNHLVVKDLLQYCPELQLAFDMLDLKIVFAAVHCMWKNNQTVAHIDRVPWQARINVPILNTKGSNTVFYTNVQYKEDIHVMANGRKFDVYTITNRDYIEIDRVEIDQPTVLRVREAHNVIINETIVPRITLTLGFDKDPIYMLHDVE